MIVRVPGVGDVYVGRVAGVVTLTGPDGRNPIGPCRRLGRVGLTHPLYELCRRAADGDRAALRAAYDALIGGDIESERGLGDHFYPTLVVDEHGTGSSDTPA